MLLTINLSVLDTGCVSMVEYENLFVLASYFQPNMFDCL